MSTLQSAPALVPQRRERAGTIYNRAFWFAYAANVSLVMANALTFRFAELVAYLGGTEQVAGGIVSVGVMGALCARLLLGQAIDHHGARRLWIIAALMFVAGCLLFLSAQSLSWQIYAARIAFSIGLAGMFTCSMVHIQNQVPPHRRTEVIGSLGSSGFIGMTLGTQLGDWIFHAFADGRPRFLALFGIATVLGMLYFAIVVFLTRNDVHERPQETPAAHRLILRYWPGNVVFVAVMMGIAFTVTTVFLTRFATERGLGGIGTFFTAFAVSAFTFRIAGRRWSRSIGRHRLIVLGLAGHGMGLGLLSFVTSEWHLIIPAIGSGFGHALLFPSVLSLGAGTFPQQYRGSGTTILLGFTEVGAILSAPLLGGMIDRYGFSPMFTVTAGMSLLLAAVYALTDARKPDDDIRGDRPRPTDEQEHLSRRHTPISPPSKRDGSIAVPFPHVGRSA